MFKFLCFSVTKELFIVNILHRRMKKKASENEPTVLRKYYKGMPFFNGS